jgi:hypothetical protein
LALVVENTYGADLRGTNGQQLDNNFNGLLNFAKAMSLDTLTAMVSIDSDLNMQYANSQLQQQQQPEKEKKTVQINTEVQETSISQSSPNNGYNNMISASQDVDDDYNNPHINPNQTPQLTPTASPSGSMNNLRSNSSSQMSLRPPTSEAHNNSASELRPSTPENTPSEGTVTPVTPQRPGALSTELRHQQREQQKEMERPGIWASLFGAVKRYFGNNSNDAGDDDSEDANTSSARRGVAAGGTRHRSGSNTELTDIAADIAVNVYRRVRSLSNSTLAFTSAAPASAPDAKLSPTLYFELCMVCMDQFR